LDGGIPDTLLEGLGFYASSGDAEMTSEADEILDERSQPETVEEPHPLTAMSSTATGRILFHVFIFVALSYTRGFLSGTSVPNVNLLMYCYCACNLLLLLLVYFL